MYKTCCYCIFYIFIILYNNHKNTICLKSNDICRPRSLKAEQHTFPNASE